MIKIAEIDSKKHKARFIEEFELQQKAAALGLAPQPHELMIGSHNDFHNDIFGLRMVPIEGTIQMYVYEHSDEEVRTANKVRLSFTILFRHFESRFSLLAPRSDTTKHTLTTILNTFSFLAVPIRLDAHRRALSKIKRQRSRSWGRAL